ncbi:threonine-phosphate decarboxylase CobD [Aquisalimonas sp. APHAB1-3]|uniref:threonine-phosphate decarboxylase CobD n=1 Tax=Aquisalimonas sp. APHAB1-3 TaxID=3402080 RepID=UPI003AABE857
MVPDHGGRLNRAAATYGIPPEHWLDLSTGINPWPWPVPELPQSVWQRLPEADDDLPAIAKAWAGAPSAAGCVATAGSQAVIQALPRLRAPCRVGVPDPGYAEHAWWWRQQGHAVIPVPHDDVDAHLDHLDVLVWIHPNNPTGLTVPAERLLQWHHRLQARDGWLVVDEAFIDPTPEHSVAFATGADGLLVMRSLGKFFGLAGLRGGFLFGPEPLCDRLDTLLGPWAVSHPARWLMRHALADRAWQEANRGRLDAGAAALDRVLRRHGLTPAGGTGLFRYCPHADAAALQDRLAREGILVRLFREPAALRLGLAPDEAALARLDAALSI